MNEFFLTVLEMSLSASFLAVALIIIRAVLKKAPKSVICFLWSFVAVRLLCPYSPESKLSVIPSGVGNVSKTVALPNESGAIAAVSQNSAGLQFEEVLPEIFAAVWIAGIIFMLLYSLISYLKLHKILCISQKISENIWICDYINTPFIFGIFSPKIYLPSSIDAEKSKCVIAHEMSHLKRRDNIWKPLGFIILSIYWFNPIMWLSYILFCRDIEFACDERVIRKMAKDERVFYSKTLLSCSSKRLTVAACPLAFGETGVKERIKKVINYTKPKMVVKVAAGVLCVFVAVCFMTNPVANAAESKPADNYPVEKKAPVETTTEIVSTTESATEIVTEKPTEPESKATTSSSKSKNSISYDDDDNYDSDSSDNSNDEEYRDADIFGQTSPDKTGDLGGGIQRANDQIVKTAPPTTTSVYSQYNHTGSYSNNTSTTSMFPYVPPLF